MKSGIVRTRLGMQKAIKTLEEIAPKLAHPKRGERTKPRICIWRDCWWRDRHWPARKAAALTTAWIVRDHDDKKFLKHSVVTGERVRFV